MSESNINLEFSYTEREYLRASRVYMFHTSEIVSRLFTFSILVTIALTALPVLLPGFPLWAAVALALLVLASILYNTLVRMPQQLFRGDGKYRDVYSVTLADEGITVRTKQIESKLAWSLYTRLIEVSDLFLLVYGTHVGQMTVLPKRAFASETQEAAFRALVARHISAR
jgi:type III secretory pathway component EscV